MQAGSDNRGTQCDAHIQLLGGFAVCVAGKALPAEAWKSRRARSLVQLLALAPNHRLHRDQVMDALWPDFDLSAAVNNLHQTLYALRKILGPTAGFSLRLEESFLSLTVKQGQTLTVDVELFEAAAARARENPSLTTVQEALDGYPGDLLPDDRYESWSIPRREALRQVVLQLLLDLARLQENQRDVPAAIDTLLHLLAADPAHEEAHTQLMRLYALSGHRQQALRQFQTLRAALRAEADAEPGQQATQVYETIQAGHLAPPQPLAHALPTGTVTFLFTDIVGSTSLWERQPELMAQALGIHNSALRQTMEEALDVVR